MTTLTTKSGIKIARLMKLPIDAILFKDHEMLEHTKIERKMVASLIPFLEGHGFNLNSVHDGEEEEFYTDQDADTRLRNAMNLIFNLDLAYLFFTNNQQVFHRVDIVLGNDGWDCISDWRYSVDDKDGFNALMQQFCDEVIPLFED